MKTTFLSKLIYEDFVGGKYVKLYSPFSYYSEVLGREINIPHDFICDKESVPVIRSNSSHAGVIHDYFCRVDSDPVVDKQGAADLYVEAQTCRDNMLEDGWVKKIWRRLWRNTKTATVRVWPGYFHKFKVLSTYEEIIGEQKSGK